jgi:predicted GIY-YIG superfamily endonuclease
MRHFLTTGVSMDFSPIGPFPGIYLLDIDGKQYIGSSKNINRRITEHKRLLQLNNHYNSKLQQAYNSAKLFKWFCIEECEEKDLLITEQKFIDLLSPELNMSPEAGSIKLTAEQVHEKQGGERNHQAKITLEQAIAVVRKRNLKLTLKEISELLDIQYSTVVYICSAGGWKSSLTEAIPEEYAQFESNVVVLGKQNQGKTVPSNRLFNDTTLLDVLHSLLKKETLQSIANRYNTSKAVISSIKNYKVYCKDIDRLLDAAEHKSFMELKRCK